MATAKAINKCYVMQMKHIINHLGNNAGEILRFCVVGGIAVCIQYGVYWLLLAPLGYNVAMTLGYLVSFIFNFIASTLFTFRVKPNARRGAGFALSHVVNYFLQMLTLNLFILLGVSKRWAPLPMFAICVPVNFLLVRFFLKR